MFRTSKISTVQSGRTLIELLIVLAVLALVSIGGLLFFRKAVDTHKATSIVEDVQLALSAHSEKMFFDAPSDTDLVDCSTYISPNNALESCFCQQSSTDEIENEDGTKTKVHRKVAICNFVVKTQGVADVLIKRLKIARINGGTKSFCVHTNLGSLSRARNKHYSKANVKDRRSFGWKNCACAGADLSCNFSTDDGEGD